MTLMLLGMPHPDPGSLLGEVGANADIGRGRRSVAVNYAAALAKDACLPSASCQRKHSTSTLHPCTPLQFVKIRESEKLENPKTRCPEP